MPLVYDLLSIDVEGFERQVIEGMDFDKFKTKILVVEVDLADRDMVAWIDEFLKKKGYAMEFEAKHNAILLDSSFVIDDSKVVQIQSRIRGVRVFC